MFVLTRNPAQATHIPPKLQQPSTRLINVLAFPINIGCAGSRRWARQRGWVLRHPTPWRRLSTRVKRI